MKIDMNVKKNIECVIQQWDFQNMNFITYYWVV